jgi:hypothetical protein
MHFIGYTDLIQTAQAIIAAPLDVTEAEIDRLQAIDAVLEVVS